MIANNYINHIALVLDGSGSMSGLISTVVKVADAQIAYLAQRSKELDQETRVTIYTFEGRDQIKCLVYDKDVLRLPSIKDAYRAHNETPLIDATLKALEDLAKTAQLYGDHSFLCYVITDGAENASYAKPSDLERHLKRLADNWTVACFVPNATGVHEAKRFGFAKDNIAIWNTTASGVSEVGETIRKATDSFMTARATGVRGTKNLFSLDTSALSKTAVAAALTEFHPGQYRLFKAPEEGRIDDFIEKVTKRAYRIGEAYYELIKPVKVQASKRLALIDRKTKALYTGDNARTLLGLPSHEVKVTPAVHPNYDIFIQSTSVNRKLFGGQKVVVLSAP